jgi:hypothetical protein
MPRFRILGLKWLTNLAQIIRLHAFWNSIKMVHPKAGRMENGVATASMSDSALYGAQVIQTIGQGVSISMSLWHRPSCNS